LLKAAKTKNSEDLVPSFERASLKKRAREEQLKMAVDYTQRNRKLTAMSDEFESDSDFGSSSDIDRDSSKLY
jgi:hypothetical protein